MNKHTLTFHNNNNFNDKGIRIMLHSSFHCLDGIYFRTRELLFIYFSFFASIPNRFFEHFNDSVQILSVRSELINLNCALWRGNEISY